MAITKQLYTVPTRYKTFRYTFRVVHRADSPYYTQKEIDVETIHELEGTFDVVIDVPALIDLVVRRAQQNKSCRANLLDGLATAKLRGKPKVLKETKIERPMRESYVRVKENGRG